MIQQVTFRTLNITPTPGSSLLQYNFMHTSPTVTPIWVDHGSKHYVTPIHRQLHIMYSAFTIEPLGYTHTSLSQHVWKHYIIPFYLRQCLSDIVFFADVGKESSSRWIPVVPCCPLQQGCREITLGRTCRVASRDSQTLWTIRRPSHQRYLSGVAW